LRRESEGGNGVNNITISFAGMEILLKKGVVFIPPLFVLKQVRSDESIKYQGFDRLTL
jgi:hypothetical protein